MQQRITVNPNVHFGKPCVAGKRIPVQNVLELIEEGLPFDEIITGYYPQLTFDNIKACLQLKKRQSEGIHSEGHLCSRRSDAPTH